MKSTKIFWQSTDRFGGKRAAFLGSDGKLRWPLSRGTVFGELSELHLRNNPGILQSFDVCSLGAVYYIEGSHYVVEGHDSRTFKPLEAFLAANADRKPVVAEANGKALGKRSELKEITL